MSPSSSRRRIKVEALARVEGEGALDVTVKGGQVTDLKFRIFEPPRFFEALLVGRQFSDVPDITARICGICPIAYMMGASQALENAFGITVGGPLRDLRRLIYCGEWIESHVLHVYMLHAPDFLGLADSLELAKTKPEIVETALRLKKLGNRIIEVVGGRAVHPVNLKVGGFYKLPNKAEIKGLAEELKWAIEASEATARLVATFPFPDLEQDYTFVALQHPDEYGIHEGRLVSNRGLNIAVNQFHQHFVEEHVAHSNALHGIMRDGTVYKVGPLARYAVNFEQLSPRAKALAAEVGLGRVVTNPFKSIIVRAIETLVACEDALAIVENYAEPDAPQVPFEVRAGHGEGCTEAPRGICHHAYDVNADGTIAKATIVPPTAQNQKIIEDDLRRIVESNLDLPDPDLTWRCEQTIRNYDPCISCATHFLDMRLTRED